VIRASLISLIAVAAQASTTVSLTPTADAYLRSAAPTSNFGGAGALLVSGASTAKGAFATVMKFDVSTAAAAFDTEYGAGNWALTGLSLQLNVVTPNNSTFNANTAGNVSVQWISDDTWTESGVTWSSLPLPGTAESAGTFLHDGTVGTYTYGLSSGSSGWVNDVSAGSIASFYLTAIDPLMSITMNSRNQGLPSVRPTLSLTAVPEPTRATLLCSAVMSMFARRRRSHCH
jgi:hypothetical protein